MSPREMWLAYVSKHGNANQPQPPAEYFCDNQKDADTCAELVLRGVKRATTGSLMSYESEHAQLPRPGNLLIVTYWNGEATCIIKTTKVDVMPFKNVSANFAALEGEGDGSLTHWREAHAKFFHREFQHTPYKFDENSQVVCEEFQVIFP